MALHLALRYLRQGWARSPHRLGRGDCRGRRQQRPAARGARHDGGSWRGRRSETKNKGGRPELVKLGVPAGWKGNDLGALAVQPVGVALHHLTALLDRGQACTRLRRCPANAPARLRRDPARRRRRRRTNPGKPSANRAAPWRLSPPSSAQWRGLRSSMATRLGRGKRCRRCARFAAGRAPRARRLLGAFGLK
jgi:hypothetical protein